MVIFECWNYLTVFPTEKYTQTLQITFFSDRNDHLNVL
jgi:hypothetical protein